VAVQYGNIFLVKMLLMNELYCIQDAKGLHPLHLAVLTNRLNMLKVLVDEENQTQVNLAQLDGFTPLHYACHKGNKLMFQYLIKKGADVTLKSAKGVSCLHLACAGGHLEIVSILIENNDFNPHMLTVASQSEPVHVAARGGHLSVVKYLVEQHKVNPAK